MLDARAGADADMTGCGRTTVDEECGGTSRTVARDLSHASVGVEQADFTVGIVNRSGDMQPPVGANSGMAVADGARQIGGRNSRRHIGSGGQQKIILRAVGFEKWNRHGMEVRG